MWTKNFWIFLLPTLFNAGGCRLIGCLKARFDLQQWPNPLELTELIQNRVQNTAMTTFVRLYTCGWIGNFILRVKLQVVCPCLERGQLLGSLRSTWAKMPLERKIRTLICFCHTIWSYNADLDMEWSFIVSRYYNVDIKLTQARLPITQLNSISEYQ